MAFVIEKTSNAVNLLDSEKEASKNILYTFPVGCVCTLDQLAKNVIFIVNGDRVREVPFYDIRYKDFGGSVTTWTGTIVAFVNKINNEYFIESGGYLPTGASTLDKQDEQLQQATDYFGKKNIGKILDLANTNGGNSWAGYPLVLVAPPAFSFVFNFGTDFEISAPLTAVNATDLVSILNNSQDYIAFP